ncbi:MAG: RES family NAD+ phosphorylase [Bacteroidota bacterium]
MLVYRISKKEYIHDLSGAGAGLYGGRWNRKGINMLYTAATIALAYVEFLVHNYHVLKTTRVCLAEIQIDQPGTIITVNKDNLPEGWPNSNAGIKVTQKAGTDFITKNEHYLLKAPSAIVPGEYNYLINPRHPNHVTTTIKHLIDPLEYDPRLLDDR